MTIAKPAFPLLLVLLLGYAGFSLAQDYSEPPRIINTDYDTIKYCSDSVRVAPNISIRNIKIDEAKEGMKISIANYKRNEDFLVWDKVDGFEYTWDSYYGQVEIRGIGTEEQYEEAISKIYYKNIATVPTLGVRSFSISLTDADYLPATQHFYRYIEKLDITWKEAKAAADTMKYYGLQGYLATITSSVENDFVWTKIDGVGWIGATDSETEGTSEGKWIWATGPEAGTHFWQGNYNGYAVGGEYSYWNNGEPNNVNKGNGIDEDYAHINANPNTIPKSWNDLPNAGDGPNSTYYRAQGFIVEFGGMKDDPTVKLSASAVIQVSKIAFSDEREFEICDGESQRLNFTADNSYSYFWTPSENMNGSNTSNPVVYPNQTTVYTVVGKLDFCRDTAEFMVHVNPLPQSLLQAENIYCKGDSITLDPGEHTSYLWSNGSNSRTITVAGEGTYWVRLKNEFDCQLFDTVDVKWSTRPDLDYSAIDTLVCGSKSQKLTLGFSGATANIRLIPLDSGVQVSDESTLTPTVTVNEFAKYRLKMEINDEYGCQFLDTLNMEFHNQPEARIIMDEQKCKGYSLELSFGGTRVEDALFSWYYNDSVYQSGTNLEKVILPLGYGELNRRVGLKVNEQACVDSSIENVTVTPIVEIITDNTEGCTPLLVQFEAKATEAVGEYTWDLGDGTTSALQFVSNQYVNALSVDTTFDVSLTVVSKEGCTNTGTMEDLLLVHPKPTVDLSFEEEECNPEQMEIWYEGSGNDADVYHWDLSSLLPGEVLADPGNTKGPLEFQRSSEPTAEIGIHLVSEFGCNSDTIIKTWQRKPIFEIQLDTVEGCPPLGVLVQAQVLDGIDEVDFRYDLGDGTIGSGQSADHIYTAANTKNRIQFTGTSGITGCSDTIQYKDSVFVYPVPEAAFIPVPEVVLVSDPEIVFENNTAGANFYEWDFGDMSAISSEQSPMHRYADMGFYDVSLFSYNDLGCLDSTSKRIIVAFDRLFPPNAFSPNATMEEDREFRIHSEGVADEGYRLLIFNRWGEAVFESSSQQQGWDGKMKNGDFAPTGVYTWVLQYLDFRGEKHNQQGTVALVY